MTFNELRDSLTPVQVCTVVRLVAVEVAAERERCALLCEAFAEEIRAVRNLGVDPADALDLGAARIRKGGAA